MLPTALPATDCLTNAQRAIEKFYALTDSPRAPRRVCQRMFFEVLRMKNMELSDDELQTYQAVAELLDELEQARESTVTGQA